ncbi:general stress protein 69 [mine drainage metagenome]|uniref:General stress protein 69 n=1 Tax=mine drainage metagenome TaxID=410659 RepID=A0A1J5R1A8_9ZZZZ
MDKRINIIKTDLQVSPLCLGGNVFGWSADEATSKAILSEFVANGGNFIDTADVYSEWKSGNTGGESETIIGNWMKESGNRDQVIIATKVAKYSKRPGLSASNIKLAVEDSLRRLQTDYIDIYYAHEDDQTTPLEESLGAFNELVESGKVGYIAASNYSGARLTEALLVSAINGFSSYVAIQNEYNVLVRDPFETDIAPVLKNEGISAIPYFGLARGFLTGKYRQGLSVDSIRADGVKGFQNERGWRVLGTLEEIAKSHDVTISAVALAWLRGQESVSVPIASARTLEQLREIMQFVALSPDELKTIDEASRT